MKAIIKCTLVMLLIAGASVFAAQTGGLTNTTTPGSVGADGSFNPATNTKTETSTDATAGATDRASGARPALQYRTCTESDKNAGTCVNGRVEMNDQEATRRQGYCSPSDRSLGRC